MKLLIKTLISSSMILVLTNCSSQDELDSSLTASDAKFAFEVLRYKKDKGAKAMAISTDGEKVINWGIGYEHDTEAEAQETALEECNSDLYEDEPTCVMYAIGDTLVWKK